MSIALPQSIDDTAIDGRKTLAQRLAVSVLAAAVLQASLSPAVMLPWLVVLLMSELLAWLATRRIEEQFGGTGLQRAVFLGHIALSTSLWSLISIWLWLSGRTGLQAVGAVIICAQLIHAQASPIGRRPCSRSAQVSRPS